METGSLVHYPCAFRIVTVDGAMLNIQSERVTNINAGTGGVSFQQFAEDSLRTRLLPLVTERLKDLLFFSEQEAAALAPFAVDALVANYAGDEMPPEALIWIQEMTSSPDPRRQKLGMLVGGIWLDLAPTEDNDLVVPFAWDENN